MRDVLRAPEGGLRGRVARHHDMLRSHFCDTETRFLVAHERFTESMTKANPAISTLVWAPTRFEGCRALC